MFRIDPETGQVSVARAGLDYEERAVYELTVEVKDVDPARREKQGLIGSTTLTVSVKDMNEKVGCDAPCSRLHEDGTHMRVRGVRDAWSAGVAAAQRPRVGARELQGGYQGDQRRPGSDGC